MKRTVLMLAVTLAVGIVVGVIGDEVLSAQHVKVTRVITADLVQAEGLEGILDLVEIAPEVTGGKHYHPGSEIVYALEGSIFIGLEGKPDLTMEAGDAVYLPRGQVMFGKTMNEAAKILVFRVHPKGQPIRLKAE